MFHGIIRKDNGFAPFDDDNGAGFERCVKEVQTRDGLAVNVVKYSEVEWPIYEHRPLPPRIVGRIKRLLPCR